MIFRCSFMAASGLLDDSRPSLRDCCCSLLCSAVLGFGWKNERQTRKTTAHAFNDEIQNKLN
jgi:hypothetical protein